MLHFNPIASSNLLNVSAVASSSQQSVQSCLTPAFLARFPRSLSSLSLGGKKKTEKESSALNITLPDATNLDLRLDKNRLISVDNRSMQPPPLPQRNFTRRSQPSPTISDGVDGDSSNIDLSPIGGVKKKGKTEQDNNKTNNNNNNNNYYNEKSGKNVPSKSSTPLSASAANKVKKRSKTKIKANSDPKISAQLFIQMEREHDAEDVDGTSIKKDLIAATGHSIANEPPPLPPRQPGMLEENQNLLNNNKCASNATPSSSSSNNTRHESRPSPNSLETRLNYPLIATATAVRGDNISPFPLSNRPNIRQRLQQQNTHQHVSKSIVQITRLTNILFDPRKTIKQNNKKKNEFIVMTIVDGLIFIHCKRNTQNHK